MNKIIQCWLFVLLLSACNSRQQTGLSPAAMIAYAQDADRFIAHAGGQIDGHNYTNSVEALQLSYRRGFRKLELDLIQTADGHYVAAHDWPKWQRMTGYEGDLPPNRAQFLQQRIWGQYSPMDMTLINQWFSAHDDAILVTDKVNDVQAMVEQFIDKDRLVMEVFSWQAVQTGLDLGLRSVMPTGNLLSQFDGSVVAHLQALGVSEVSVSRNFLNKQPALIAALKQADIRMYAFHVNRKKGKGTAYMICHESHVFYGFYANLWQADWQPECDEPDVQGDQ